MIDGLEAVQKAEELRRDLILLDIGLPKLNGIEAALQIQQRASDSAISFLNEISDRDVVRAASAREGGAMCSSRRPCEIWQLRCKRFFRVSVS